MSQVKKILESKFSIIVYIALVLVLFQNCSKNKNENALLYPNDESVFAAVDLSEYVEKNENALSVDRKIICAVKLQNQTLPLQAHRNIMLLAPAINSDDCLNKFNAERNDILGKLCGSYSSDSVFQLVYGRDVLIDNLNLQCSAAADYYPYWNEK